MGTVDIIIAVLGGSALSALITQIGSAVQQRRKRKYDKEDKKDDDSTVIKQGLKLLIADKLQYLGTKHIEKGYISFSDRKMLHEMHSVYHNGLGGNGDFDVLMDEINELPLKG